MYIYIDNIHYILNYIKLYESKNLIICPRNILVFWIVEAISFSGTHFAEY